VVDIAEKVREARLRWYIWTYNKRDEGELVRHYGMKRSEDVEW
jgi:hypothetical protein